MLKNYCLLLFLFFAICFELFMAIGSGSLEEEPNGSLEGKPKNNYFINKQEKQLFFQLASLFLFKYNYEELRITENDDILKELIKTFFPSLVVAPIFVEIFGKKKLSKQKFAIFYSSSQNPKNLIEALEESIVKFVKKIEDKREHIHPKKEFDIKLEEKKLEKIIKLFKLNENEVEENGKLYMDIWIRVNKNYKMNKKIVLFYYLLFWQIAMDYSDHQQEETSPIREWILDTLIPLMDKKLMPSVTGYNVDALIFNLRILFRTLPEEKSTKRQLDFAFRIAPMNREECNQYCVNAIGILKKEIINIKTTGIFDRIIDDFSNLPDESEYDIKRYLPRCRKIAEKKALEMKDNRENLVRKLFITFYDCMIKSLIHSNYGDNYEIVFNSQKTFLEFLLQNMIGDLVENEPAIHLELAYYQINAIMLSNELTLELSHSFHLWPFKENRDELESKLFKGILRIAQEKSQTITMEELIGKIELKNAHFVKFMFASKNVLAGILDRAKIKTKDATKNALVLTKGIETICFLKYYYEKIIDAYKEKTGNSELLPDKVANLNWQEKGLLPDLKSMLKIHGLGEDKGI